MAVAALGAHHRAADEPSGKQNGGDLENAAREHDQSLFGHTMFRHHIPQIVDRKSYN
jgi:hypothetical protein